MYRQRAILITFVLLTICQFNNPAGSNQQYLPTSCTEAVHFSGRKPSSGIYKLHLQLPDRGYTSFYGYCLLDPKGGEAWTVIQRRKDKSIHFNRNWRDYKYGFGNLNANFFIGLDKLHALTEAQLHELWIQLKDFDDVERTMCFTWSPRTTGMPTAGYSYPPTRRGFDDVEKDATYESFAIGGEEEKYPLTVLGTYSGTAGDALIGLHDGCRFSTYDEDNSERGTNCAKMYKGGWWFGKELCLTSFLNGPYMDKPSTSYGEGLIWSPWHGRNYSLKYVHMAIRPKYNSFA